MGGERKLSPKFKMGLGKLFLQPKCLFGVKKTFLRGCGKGGKGRFWSETLLKAIYVVSMEVFLRLAKGEPLSWVWWCFQMDRQPQQHCLGGSDQACSVQGQPGQNTQNQEFTQVCSGSFGYLNEEPPTQCLPK